ncbi:MAG: CotH kinase family protein [Aureispira sp.]
MNSLKYIGWSIAIISTLLSCYKEEITFNNLPNKDLELPLLLNFDDRDCFFDEQTDHLRYSIAADSIPNFSPVISFKKQSKVLINGKPLIRNKVNNLGTVQINKEYPVEITMQGKTKEFTLSFTNLPMARITTLNQIVDEPQRLAHWTLYYASPDSAEMSSYIGLEYRGASSQKNPKKSYGFTFLQRKNSEVPVTQSIFGGVTQEDWILDAVYNDQLKFRNKLSFEIWKAMNPTKNVAIASNYVEVYLNNDYQGIYCLNEKISPAYLQLTAYDAVLYKGINWDGSTSFEFLNDNAPPLYTNYWDGWEQKYPDTKERVNWGPLFELRDWVLNTSDARFIAEASNQVDLENMMDYYLFIYVTGARDNHGKNMFWLKPTDNSPFYIIPWDVDAAWGRHWDARILSPMQPRENKLFERLIALNPDNFTTKLKARWRSLRANSWSNTAIEALLDKEIKRLAQTDVIALDNARWGTVVNLELERAYVKGWMGEQYRLLDLYFDNM